jgi:uncharacterized protein
MAEFTIPKHGEICWRELNTQNLEKAKEFYQELLGWKLEQSKATEFEYPEIHVGGKAVGGMMRITKDWGENWENIPPAWMSYIAVDDCAETVEKIKEHGGSVCIEPFDAPNVGRIAVAGDPGGAFFSVIQFVQE